MRGDGNGDALPAHIQYDEREEKMKGQRCVCVVLQRVRITRNRPGLRGKGLTDTQDITRRELE